MKKVIFLTLIFSFFFIHTLISQSSIRFEDSFSENTSDEVKFRLYLDTLDKYIYKDFQIAKEAIDQCEFLISKGTKVSNSDQLEYGNYLLDFEQEKGDLLASYQIIQEYQHLLDEEDIPISIKTNFIYIRGFVSMSLGDLEFAQKT